ncbi:MAG: hypothetical protein AB7F19_06800 [Candidatus Babeliales bacterium]
MVSKIRVKNSTTFLVLSLVILAGMVASRTVSFNGNCGAINTCAEGRPFSFSGSAKIADKTIPSLSGAGSATLKDVIVQGAAKHSGSFKAEGGSFGSLKVSGAVTLSETSVAGKTKISGCLDGKKTTFAAIEIASNKSVLTECTAASIAVKASSWPIVSPILELDGTTVLGDITFEGTEGQVIMRNGAVVKGNISNGVIVQG